MSYLRCKVATTISPLLNFVSFNMRSPMAYFDPQHTNMTCMFVSLFNDEMRE